MNLQITKVQDTGHIVNFPNCLDLYSSISTVQGQDYDSSVPLNTSICICMVKLASTTIQ